jgi:hypothetical protein
VPLLASLLTFSAARLQGRRHPRRPVSIRRRQGRPQDRPRQAAHPQLPRHHRPPGHLDRNDLRYGQATIPALAEPTPDQRRAFDLIGAPIPLTLSIT